MYEEVVDEYVLVMVVMVVAMVVIVWVMTEVRVIGGFPSSELKKIAEFVLGLTPESLPEAGRGGPLSGSHHQSPDNHNLSTKRRRRRQQSSRARNKRERRR